MGASSDDGLIARLAVDNRLLTAAQAEEALAVRACYGEEKSLGQVMLDLRYIGPDQLAWLESRVRDAADSSTGPTPPPRASLPSDPAGLHRPARPTLVSDPLGGVAVNPRPPPPSVQRPGRPPVPVAGRVSAPPPVPKKLGRPVPPAIERPTMIMPERGVPAASPPAPPGVTGAASPSSNPVAPSPRDAMRSQPPEPATSSAPPPGQRTLDKMLAQAVRMKASDVHIHTGASPQVRVGGKLFTDKTPPLDAARTEAAILKLLTAEQRQTLLESNDVDFVYSLPGVGRFRANAYKQFRGYDAVFRYIKPDPPTLDELGLAKTLAPVTKIHNGMILLTGPASCGKSSTLAALVRQINEERAAHIITVEDPIEYVHKAKRSLVTQREVKTHTESFAFALRAALRQHPNVIAIGELRDLETIQLAVTAAETGHLVLGTLHTSNAVRSINRILDVFPPEQQPQVRAMLSDSLRAVVSQRLLPSADGKSRVPVVELLLVTHAVSNMIREEKTHQLRSVLTTAGRSIGMIHLDDALVELVKSGAITKEVARRYAEDPRSLA